MNVLDLAQRHVQLRKVATTKGGEWQGPCPGCGGDDRFHVWPENGKEGEGSYWCRQCEKTGDAIQFLRDFEGLSFQEACARLGRDLPTNHDLKTPKEPQRNIWQPEDKVDAPDLWKEKAWKFVTWAFDQIWDHPEILTYLAKRGISEEIIRRFGLGWNGGDKEKDVFRSRESWGLSKLISKNGKAKSLWLPIGLVISYIRGSEVQRIRIRRPDPLSFGSRYYVVPGSSMETMMINPDHPFFVVTEAELDAYMLAHRCEGLAGAIGLGSASTKPDKKTMALLKNAGHILLALDADSAGAKAINWWGENFADCSYWPVPNGKDPGEAFEAGVDIMEWVNAGLKE